jgi:hypothetical protein
MGVITVYGNTPGMSIKGIIERGNVTKYAVRHQRHLCKT